MDLENLEEVQRSTEAGAPSGPVEDQGLGKTKVHSCRMGQTGWHDHARKCCWMSGEERLHSIKQVAERHIVIWGVKEVISNDNLGEELSPWIQPGCT